MACKEGESEAERARDCANKGSKGRERPTHGSESEREGGRESQRERARERAREREQERVEKKKEK